MDLIIESKDLRIMLDKESKKHVNLKEKLLDEINTIKDDLNSKFKR